LSARYADQGGIVPQGISAELIADKWGITREGRALWRDANITFRAVLQRHFAQSLTDTDIVALTRVLGKL
jgi:hypothetical protein